MTSYVATTEAVVSVDGQPVTVEPSTPVPERVEQAELDRLERFGVIRKGAAKAQKKTPEES